MRQYTINTIVDYFDVLKRIHLTTKTMIYRGQANSEWEITSSAYRELSKDGNNSVAPSILRDYHNRLIEGVRRLHDISISNEDDITILSQLQHNKAKTILIDYTYNPLAALWFACSDKSNEGVDGCVYAVEECFTQNIFPLNNRDLDFLFKNSDLTYAYHPDQINQRIINQQSVFLIRWLGKIDKSQQLQILVPYKKKKGLLDELQVLGVTKKVLFPDFIGYIDTFEFDNENRNVCSNLVISARESLEIEKPNFSDAKSMLNKALDLASSFEGVEYRAYILHELGYISYRNYNFSEAISYYDKALEEKKKYLTENDFGIIYTETAMGLTYIKMGDYNKAFPLFEKVNNLQQSSVENNLFFVKALSNIANIYRELGLYNEAKVLAEKAEKNAEKQLGTESRQYAYIINSVGNVYAKIGREKESMEKYETALRIFRRNYVSEDNLDVIYTYLKIAGLYKLNKNSDGLVEESEYLKIALSLLEKMPKSIAVKRCYAHAYTVSATYCYMNGEYDKAIEFCKSAMEYSKSFGEDHPKMIDTYMIYGDALYSKRKFKESLKFFQKAKNELSSVSAKHPDIIVCNDKIADINNKLRKDL